MKKIIFFLVLSSLIVVGCSNEISNEESIVNETSTLNLADTKYTMFILNVHDWLDESNSIEAVNKVIDIHEKYEVPVNIYLTDPMVQLYAEKAPDLIERFKTSKYVTISYHCRPPSPYYSNFDIVGLHDLSDQAIYDEIMKYETHKIDLKTGLPTEEEGGYAYLAELIGYAPVTVGVFSEYKNVEAQALKVYKDLGATFTLVHGRESVFGDKKGNLYLRPEQIELKLYESKALASKAEDVIEKAMGAFTGDASEGVFMNIKFHEDNFYLNGTPWIYNFYSGAQYSEPKSTPFDITTVKVKEKTDVEKAHIWELYDDGVKYIKDHEDTMHPISEFDLQNMLNLI